jgi:hypothetical protein
MKNLLLVCCTVLAANFLQAQVTPAVPQLQTKPHGFKSNIPTIQAVSSDSSVYFIYTYPLQSGLQQTKPTVDNMPVVGFGEITITVLGNNNQGFTLYSATPDNMPVVKPDATFHSNMPIVGATTNNPVFKP